MDYDRIWSLINAKGLSKRKFAQSIGMTGQGFKTMMEGKSLRVDVLEKICEVYEKPLSYFYDNIEHKSTEYDVKEVINISDDPVVTTYACADCIEKENTIKDLRANLNDLRKHIDFLEFSLGKKKALSK